MLKAGSDIMGEITYAVENNRYEDLGTRVSARVMDATRTFREANRKSESGMSEQSNAENGPEVYYGDVEKTNRRDGTYRVNYSDIKEGNKNKIASIAVGGIAGAAFAGPVGAVAGAALAGAVADGTKNKKKKVTDTGKNTPPSRMVYTTPFFRKKVAEDKGIVRIVFGSIGSIGLGLGGLILGLIAIGVAATGGVASAVSEIILAIVLLMGAAGFCSMLSGGCKDHKLAGLFHRFGNALGNAEYFSVRDLALRLGMKEKTVRKALIDMMNKGFLPYARFDNSQTTLILTDQSYEQYMQAEQSRSQREQKVTEVPQKETPQTDVSQQGVEDPEARRILDEGEAYIRKIRYYNDLIPDDREMSAKLYRLENIIHRIFEQVKKNPGCAGELRRFLEYYLPTTDKLLKAYVELDRQPEAGNNIVGTRKEIEDVLDTINDAFEKLLDSLFTDMAWDVSSDISVMKTMMARDGLVGSTGPMNETTK